MQDIKIEGVGMKAKVLVLGKAYYRSPHKRRDPTPTSEFLDSSFGLIYLSILLFISRAGETQLLFSFRPHCQCIIPGVSPGLAVTPKNIINMEEVTPLPSFMTSVTELRSETS